jgi:7-cyano-7-deazaguanine synthase
MNDGVAIVSGGLDSVTMLHHLVSKGAEPWVLSFNYGQRHATELEYAQLAAERFNLSWTCIDITDVGQLLSIDPTSSLVNRNVPVPEGHYSDETMRATVVPNRNMMMLSIATSVCIALRGQYVAAGPHNGDAAIYPDCRPGFFELLQEAIYSANQGFLPKGWHFLTPFIYWTKSDIAQEAKRLQVPVELTWSCYLGGTYHCGRCGTCVERLEAMHRAGIEDPTRYMDENYWRTVGTDV